MARATNEERAELLMVLLRQMVDQYGPSGRVDVSAIIHLLSMGNVLTNELGEYIVMRIYELQKEFVPSRHLNEQVTYRKSAAFDKAMEEIKTKITEVINGTN